MKSDVKNVLKTAGESGSDASDIITSNIFENKCFGAYKDVKLIGSDGKSAMYRNTVNYIEVPQIYQSMVPVDNDTKSDFRYGIWYGSPMELREYADKYNIPVFVQIGSIGCPPCQVFTQEIYCDPEFQAFVKRQKCLFCRVVAETTEYGPGAYIQNWSGNYGIPKTMYYWKKPDGETFLSNRQYGAEWGNNYGAADISGWITEYFQGY